MALQCYVIAYIPNQTSFIVIRPGLYLLAVIKQILPSSSLGHLSIAKTSLLHRVYIFHFSIAFQVFIVSQVIYKSVFVYLCVFFLEMDAEYHTKSTNSNDSAAGITLVDF